MELVKLEIDGKRVVADSRQTLLEVARQNGIDTIPTLCHDDQLEPYASCFVCVVKVKGARSLLPACATKVSAGMVVETDNPEIRRARKASLELLLSDHIADCVGPCQLACPAGVDVQGYLALTALGKEADALALIKARNPLPAVCGRVCTRPCEVKGCRRGMLDAPVGIDFVKRAVADRDLARAEPFLPARAPGTGKKVAIIGAGPAGLACAYYLAMRGHSPHLFERMPEPGGMLRYGIPEYRLPREALDAEIGQILALGVGLSTNVALGEDFTLAGLRADGFDAIFMGVGAWESTRLKIPGEDAPNVLAGIDFLRERRRRGKEPMGGRVLVVGGGNTAIDCARTAIRLGAAEVQLLYRRTRQEMPASATEVADAEAEGVRLELLVAPSRVIVEGGRAVALECVRMELGPPDASGRRSPKPVAGSEFRLPCDTLIAAIGQGVELARLLRARPDLLPAGETLALTRWGTLQVAEGTFETSAEGVFAAGDAVSGAATVVEALAAGRKAAHAIDSWLRTGRARPEPVAVLSRRDAFGEVTRDDLRPAESQPRKHPACLPVERRVGSFAEVEKAYSADDARRESRRCLECGCASFFECDLRRYATEYGADPRAWAGEGRRHEPDRSHPLFELDSNKCILCARCARTCSELVGIGALGALRRGFATELRQAPGVTLESAGCLSCGLCIETCPTGALVEKSPLAKPGPWPVESVETVCGHCGAGCQLTWKRFGATLVRAGRGASAAALAGNHCRDGRFGYRHVQSPDRLTTGRIRTGRALQEVDAGEAIAHAALRLKEVRDTAGAAVLGVLVSPRLTNEEIYLAQKLARVGLGTHLVSSCTRLVNQELDCPEVQSTATARDLADAQAMVVVGCDLERRQFSVGLMAKKALRNGAKLVFVGPRREGIGRFADVFLRCEEGGETEVVRALVDAVSGAAARSGTAAMGSAGSSFTTMASAGSGSLGSGSAGGENSSGNRSGAAESKSGPPDEALQRAGRILADSLLKVIVFDRDAPGGRRPGDVRVFAESARALGASLLALREEANGQGLADLGAAPAWLPGYVPLADRPRVEAIEKQWGASLDALPTGDFATLLRQKRLRAVLVLGEDPLGAPGFPEDLKQGLRACEVLVVADRFLTETAREASVVLPLSDLAETSGHLTSQERRVQRIQRAVPPASGIEGWQLLCELAKGLGARFKMKYSRTDEIADEIDRVVPFHAASRNSSGAASILVPEAVASQSGADSISGARSSSNARLAPMVLARSAGDGTPLGPDLTQAAGMPAASGHPDAPGAPQRRVATRQLDHVFVRLDGTWAALEETPAH